jgi:NADPH-dependent glutamate synthase beta subunit-like oxidoreductase
VLVAGGGPAGLEAARLLALRGHTVTLCEREPELGGLALAAVAAEPNNAPLLDELLRAVAAAKIEVRLGCEVDAALVAELDPDAVVAAVGARRVRPRSRRRRRARARLLAAARRLRSGARARSARRGRRRRTDRRRDRRAA